MAVRFLPPLESTAYAYVYAYAYASASASASANANATAPYVVAAKTQTKSANNYIADKSLGQVFVAAAQHSF